MGGRRKWCVGLGGACGRRDARPDPATRASWRQLPKPPHPPPRTSATGMDRRLLGQLRRDRQRRRGRALDDDDGGRRRRGRVHHAPLHQGADRNEQGGGEQDEGDPPDLRLAGRGFGGGARGRPAQTTPPPPGPRHCPPRSTTTAPFRSQMNPGCRPRRVAGAAAPRAPPGRAVGVGNVGAHTHGRCPPHATRPQRWGAGARQPSRPRRRMLGPGSQHCRATAVPREPAHCSQLAVPAATLVPRCGCVMAIGVERGRGRLGWVAAVAAEGVGRLIPRRPWHPGPRRPHPTAPALPFPRLRAHGGALPQPGRLV